MFDPEELDLFKRTIDLRAYAAAHGFQLDKRDSWRGSAVMRHPNGDKIIIKRAASNGHWVYFSVRNDSDNGTILDFAQFRLNLSLGAVRKELRPWIGQPPVPVPAFPPLQKSATKDRHHIERDYARMQDALHHAWLEGERGLPAGLLQLERFAGRVRVDLRNNAVFPHFDAEGICGYEIRNSTFKGFCAGGRKGLWLSHENPDDNRLLVGESALDMLSFAALFPNDRARYISIGGHPSAQQPELLRAAIARMPDGSEIVSAMDADVAGAKLSEVVQRAFELSGRGDLRFAVQAPNGFKDWNDQLCGKTPLPARAKPAEAARSPCP